MDPLAILHSLHPVEQPHFYIESKHKKTNFIHRDFDGSILAIGITAAAEIEGVNRFHRAKSFIDNCLSEVITSGNSELPFAGPHFFCSFSFFNEKTDQMATHVPATIFLPRWQISCSQGICVLVANLIITLDLNLKTLIDQVQTEFQLITSTRYQVPEIYSHHRKTVDWPDSIHTHNFKAAVLSALQAISDQHLEKIVLAHAIDITASKPFNLIHSLHNLRQLYPDCYVFSINHGKGPTFIGASPERLVSVFNQELVADALAGSAPRGKTRLEDSTFMSDLLVNRKERHEHQLVIQFITQCLQHLGCQLRRSQVPHLLQLSNIQHLRTLIRAHVPPGVHLLEIVSQLHPTPAVAGLPREMTCTYIRQLETFDRGLYAGPLGWLDHRGNGEFIVGIRSALVQDRQARLYAGAGIVQGSDPDRELSEIHLKLQAILNALV
ncbi:isochorismate synthase [Leptolyngbya sp. 'hensonii']|uniref:isochorismate synthase n=1 Tax=Leptolyngbya sp. 'hensonii' TaxID=1922337 RepID=UPI001C0DDE2C|nr:isochorismate synthase [Leptolyngbya sp. 'hensonii']